MSNQDAIISLQSYAAVMAGLGAGLSLRRALLHAEVAAPAWDAGVEHWQAQIDESAASDLAVLVAFDGALLAAKRRFEPTIEPIESDPAAWCQFRRHFVTAVDPVTFLAERALSLGIYARIEASWANRVLADEALAAVIQRSMNAPLAECPALTVTPSPWLLEDGEPPPLAAMPPREEAVEVPPAPPAVVKREHPAQELGRTSTDATKTITAPMPFVRSPMSATALPFVAPGAPAPQAALGGAHPAPSVSAAPRGAATRGDLDQTITASLTPTRPVMPFRPVDPTARQRARASRGEKAPRLTLEQYASLCVELDARPDHVVETLARYYLSSEGRDALEALWKRRLAADPALFAAFGRAYTTYKASLERAGKAQDPRAKGRS